MKVSIAPTKVQITAKRDENGLSVTATRVAALWLGYLDVSQALPTHVHFITSESDRFTTANDNTFTVRVS